MDEHPHQGDFLSGGADHLSEPRSSLAVDVARRVQQIVASAEQAAAEIHRAAEAETRRQAADARAGAENDALRIRQEAEAAAQQWLTESRQRIEAVTQERITRIDELTQGLIAQCDAIQVRFEAANAIRTQVETLLVSLGDAAEQLARESSRDAGVSHLGEPGRRARLQRGGGSAARLGWTRGR